MTMAQPAPAREQILLEMPGQPTLALQRQPTTAAAALGDVVYVHGSTFGSDLSVFLQLDGRSWADAMCEAGFNVWGFDFAGYGASARYPADSARAVGRMAEVAPQLQRVVAAVRARNGAHPVALVSHSWGASVACDYAGRHPLDVAALLLFAPVVMRNTEVQRHGAYVPAAVSEHAHYPLSLWAQYRRFIEDVPGGRPQVLSEAHFQQWGTAFLATDVEAQTRMPPAVSTPAGPQADVLALWSGQNLYRPSLVAAPTMLIRGEWDTVCADADAASLGAALGTALQDSVVIEQATHLMHLESQRGLLYNACNTFLRRHSQA